MHREVSATERLQYAWFQPQNHDFSDLYFNLAGGRDPK